MRILLKNSLWHTHAPKLYPGLHFAYPGLETGSPSGAECKKKVLNYCNLKLVLSDPTHVLINQSQHANTGLIMNMKNDSCAVPYSSLSGLGNLSDSNRRASPCADILRPFRASTSRVLTNQPPRPPECRHWDVACPVAEPVEAQPPCNEVHPIKHYEQKNEMEPLVKT